ncbi:MAG: DNA repair protein RecO [bacterium]|nr:DNA repair protein RecO [bacterium]
MLRKDEGILLKSARQGETSRVVTFLGRESGKIRLLAKGALGHKSPFRGLLEPGNLIEAVYYYRNGRSQFFLREVHVRNGIRADREPLESVASSLAILELLDQTSYWGSPDEHIIDLVGEYFGAARNGDPLFIFLAFGFKLLEVFGTMPELFACSVCEKPLTSGYFHPAEGVSACTSHSVGTGKRIRLSADLLELLERMAETPLRDLTSGTVDRDLRKRLGRVLHWTYTFHVHGYTLPEALKLIPVQKHH